MTELDFFGYCGYFLIFAGMYYIGAKEPAGWFIRLLGEAIWLVLGILLGVSSIWVGGLAFVAMDLYNLNKWKADQKFISDFWSDVEELERADNRRQMKIMDGTIKFTKFGMEYNVEDFEFGAYLDHVTNGQD